jgi:hypothetical protein
MSFFSKLQERHITTGREIFGAYYDMGRMTKSTDSDPVWAALAKRSVHRYRELEELSGKVLNYMQLITD